MLSLLDTRLVGSELGGVALLVGQLGGLAAAAFGVTKMDEYGMARAMEQQDRRLDVAESTTDSVRDAAEDVTPGVMPANDVARRLAYFGTTVATLSGVLVYAPIYPLRANVRYPV